MCTTLHWSNINLIALISNTFQTHIARQLFDNVRTERRVCGKNTAMLVILYSPFSSKYLYTNCHT